MIFQKTSYINERILTLTFNLELATGTLDKNLFCYYIEKDIYYLLGFARALALIAGRTQDTMMMSDFLEFSKSVLIAEQDIIHSYYIDLFKYKKTGEITIACFAYTNFLVRHAATSSIEVAVAAISPCNFSNTIPAFRYLHPISKIVPKHAFAFLTISAVSFVGLSNQ